MNSRPDVPGRFVNSNSTNRCVMESPTRKSPMPHYKLFSLAPPSNRADRCLRCQSRHEDAPDRPACVSHARATGLWSWHAQAGLSEPVKSEGNAE
jgi:hypothetical protein